MKTNKLLEQVLKNAAELPPARARSDSMSSSTSSIPEFEVPALVVTPDMAAATAPDGIITVFICFAGLIGISGSLAHIQQYEAMLLDQTNDSGSEHPSYDAASDISSTKDLRDNVSEGSVVEVADYKEGSERNTDGNYILVNENIYLYLFSIVDQRIRRA